MEQNINNLKGITVRQEDFNGWQATVVETKTIKFCFVPQVGGRLMGLFSEGQSLYFSHPKLHGKTNDNVDETIMAQSSHELGFPLWGGDASVIGPKEKWQNHTPSAELYAGNYEMSIEAHGEDRIFVVMTSPVCSQSGLQLQKTFQIQADSPHWCVHHQMRNMGKENTEWGIWDITALNRPGHVFMPTDTKTSHPGGIKSFEDHQDSEKVRQEVVSHLGSIGVITCQNQSSFKFGTDSNKGWILGIQPGQSKNLAYLKFFETAEGREYGHGATAEVSNSSENDMFTMKSHGPIRQLIPGERAELIERHVLFPIENLPESEMDVLNLVDKEMQQTQGNW
jgi:hypothetical protein